MNPVLMSPGEIQVGHGERMRSDDGHDFGSHQVGVCRAVGTTPLGTECAGADLTVLDIKDVYHSRNQNRKQLTSARLHPSHPGLLLGTYNCDHTPVPAHIEKMAESPQQ